MVMNWVSFPFYHDRNDILDYNVHAVTIKIVIILIPG